MAIKRVTIVGVGLIGGSLGRAWKTAGADIDITGVDLPDVLATALEVGAIDRAAADLVPAVEDADLVVLATPIARIMHLLEEIGAALKPGAVVTDVGSVKAAINAYAASVLRDDVLFAGGHPMAGSEKNGVRFSDPFLFENATYVLCPGSVDDADDPRFTDLADMIERTGARVLTMSPVEHDQIAAVVSHLPQLLAVSLTNVAADRNEADHNYLRLAAGGFRDLTRVAGSDFTIWRDILVANQRPILDALALQVAELQRIRNRMIEEDTDELADRFDRARRTRDTIPKDTKGFISPLADVYVHADDRPGWIARVSTLLFESGINIKDMELLKIREGSGGTFRFSFESRETAAAAVDLLRSRDYSVFQPE